MNLVGGQVSGLREEDIPRDVLPKVRDWWGKQMAALEVAHGRHWPEHREWLVDYLNAEVRERLAARRT